MQNNANNYQEKSIFDSTMLGTQMSNAWNINNSNMSNTNDPLNNNDFTAPLPVMNMSNRHTSASRSSPRNIRTDQDFTQGFLRDRSMRDSTTMTDAILNNPRRSRTKNRTRYNVDEAYGEEDNDEEEEEEEEGEEDENGMILKAVVGGKEFVAAKSHHRKQSPRKWTAEEDEKLKEAVLQYGEKGWKDIAKCVGTRTHVQCLQRWNKVLKSDLKKGHWTQQEDELLREIVQQNIDPSDPSRPLSWATIAVTIQGRTAKQCRERWMNHLDPTVNKGPWSAQEDKILLELQKQWGNQWASIASQLKGRTQNSVKIRWKTLQHKKKKNFYMDDYSSSNAESLHSSFESMPSQPSAPKQSPSPYPLPPADIQLNLKTGSIRGSLHISLQDTNNTDNNNTNNTNVNSNITNTTLPVLTNSSMGSNTIQLLRKSQEKAGTTKVNPIYALPQSVQFNIPSSLNTNISLNHNLRSYHNSADSNITMKSSHNSINNNNDTNNDISGNTFDDSSFPPLMNSFRTSFGAGFNSSFGLLNNSFGAGLNSYNPFATSSNFLSTSQNMYIPSDSQSSLSHSFTHIPSLFGSKNNMNNININNNNNNNVYLPPPSSSDISGMSSLHNSINGNYGNLSPPSNLPPIETPPPSSFFLPHINSQGNSLNNLVPPPLLSQNNNNMNMNNMNNMNNINNKFANTSLDIHVPIVVPSSNSTTIPMTLNTPSYIIGNMNNMNNNNMNNSNNMNNNNNMNMNNSNMNNNNMNNNNMNMNNNKESNGVYNHAGISTSFNDILTTFENNLTKSNKQFDMDSNIDIPITQPNEFILEGNNMDNNTNNNNNNNNNPYYYMNDMSQLLSPPENSNINQINLPNNGDYNNYNNNIDIMDHNLEETINTIPLYDNMLFDFNNNMNTLPSSNYIPENEPLTEEGQYNDENNSIDMIQMNNSLKDLTIDIPLQHHLNH